MEIIYKLDDSSKPGDLDLFNGIQEINKNNYKTALNHFQKGADHKNEYAMLLAAIIYYTGFDLPERNIIKATELFTIIATEWNNPVAQFFLGIIYLFGEKDMPENKKSGLDWLFLSANNEWSYAKAYIAITYEHGLYVEEDHNKSLEWFEDIVKKDDSEFDPIEDGTLYLFGNKKFELDLSRVDRNIISDVLLKVNDDIILPSQLLNEEPDHIFDWPEVQRIIIWDILTNKKSSCVAACQSYISDLYTEEQNSVPEDINKVIYWTRKAAKNGNPTCCTTMSLYYEQGIGVEQNLEEANKWYKRFLTLGGHTEFKLGMFYYLGVRVEKDWKQALAYFETANRYSKEAYFYMGDIYERGKYGVAQDYKKAYEYYLKSFELGNPNAANVIALLYSSGLGVEQNEEKAIEWFKESASMGYKAASTSLDAIDKMGFKDAIPGVIHSRKIDNSSASRFSWALKSSSLTSK